MSPDRATPAPLNGIAANWYHGEGAIARCSYCGRYSLDPKTLGEDRYQPECACGQKHGWSGSFKKPDQEAEWSGRAPARAAAVVTCWRCTHPATCVDNGFCSIERRDLEDLP